MAHPHELATASSLVFARRHRRRVEAGARVYAHPARRVKNAGDAAVETTMSSASTAVTAAAAAVAVDRKDSSRGTSRLHRAFSHPFFARRDAVGGIYWRLNPQILRT